MNESPITIEQARKRRYGKEAGSSGRPYIEGRCAYEVRNPQTRLSHQCARSNGYDGLFCKTHAAFVRR